MAGNRVDAISGFKQPQDYTPGSAGLGGVNQFAGVTAPARIDGAGAPSINFAAVQPPSAENRAKPQVLASGTGSQLDIG